ncbi:MAG TPA: transporter [Novimethylophilus sp.]|uniref:transporter n=1 Tax=Novimethylophilus sp. TaxID=2137426 RepID=UPI002F3F9141
MLAFPGLAQASPPENHAADASALQKENIELATKNEALEKRIKELEAALDSTGSREQKQAPKIGNAALDDRDYQFLKLGQDTDYLQAERYRIIDQVEQSTPPLYEPARPLHGYVLPPGASRIKLDLGVAHNPSDFGRDTFYSKFFDKVRVDTLQGDLQFMYGFEALGVKDMMVNLEVPFKMVRTKGTGHPFRIDPMEMTMDGTSAGLGDISLTLKKKWLDQGNGPVTLSTMFGIIFPTGKDDEKFNATQSLKVQGMPPTLSPLQLNIFGRNPNDRLLPRILQPGQGAWGGRIGLAATHQFERSAIHGGFMYDFFAKNDGITVGNELRYGASYVFPPLESDRMSLDLAVFGRHKGAEKFPGLIMHPERNPATGGPIMDAGGNVVMFTTPRPDFNHGNVVFFSPSLSYIPSPSYRITVSPAIRIIEPNQGPSPAWTLDLSVQHTF